MWKKNRDGGDGRTIEEESSSAIGKIHHHHRCGVRRRLVFCAVVVTMVIFTSSSSSPAAFAFTPSTTTTQQHDYHHHRAFLQNVYDYHQSYRGLANRLHKQKQPHRQLQRDDNSNLFGNNGRKNKRNHQFLKSRYNIRVQPLDVKVPQMGIASYLGSLEKTDKKKENTNNDNNKKSQTKTPVIKEDDDEEDDDGNDGWLSWMSRGHKRKEKQVQRIGKTAAGKVKFREAEELGGVPRSDRYSASDWLHNTASLPSSAILKSIRFPVIFMTSWATFLSCVHRKLLEINPTTASMMCIPSAPHSLMVSALSLLLVFKTNSAYQRFAEGRKIWESIINGSRDLYRMMTLYENELGRSKRRRLQRLLAAFPYLLRHRIRPNLVMYRLDDEKNVRDPEHSIVLYQDKAADDLDPEAAAVATQEESEGKSRAKARPLYWVDKRTLPWRLLPGDAMEGCARAQNRPLWVCDRMAQELRNVPDGPNFTARERLALISKVEKLSTCIGACERIHQTAVPLNYARHSLRALTLWLLTLPFALMDSLRMVTGPVLFLVSWLLFGVYEIGYSIEDPFQGTLRLSVLCDTIRRDVLAHEVFRYTAFSVRDEVPGRTGEETSDNKDSTDEEDYESSPIPVEEPNSIADVVEELPTIPIQSDEKNQTTWYMATDESGTMLFNKKP